MLGLGAVERRLDKMLEDYRNVGSDLARIRQLLERIVVLMEAQAQQNQKK